ncbi:serine/threonine-protein kinase [Knoellia subterranea]|uniref:non-specific serine/threonine protein kinase n=1 Tax=Knoellia subterranea KCTC 19937 TaxID=1385521 RepID=A0A0A0JMQ3_9MICO|nr:serine/threonine-protein kinase [Knoellia subterranea]KGN38715.1 serine/threonine protein kinase [Knoellia subterranea KCTC 19937]
MSTTQGRLLGGRYRLGAPLGRGGMAVVWRADDEMLGREVAVKTLDLTGPDSDNAGERFRREARATAALNHPHIVTVYDTGVEADTAYLVMELLPGPTLAEEVRDSGPLPVEEVRTIGYEVAGALQAAHDAGIIHRDIKPGNISYAADGTVKVLDFGITQLVDEALGHHQLTMTDTIVGTAEYLAPEQATGQRVDSRADLYALGCVLTTLLTGQPPFTAPTPVAILMKHAHDVPADVRDLRPDTPADLAGLVNGLLAKDPAHRPQSGREVAELLQAHRAPAATEVLRPAAAAAPTAVVPRQQEWSEPAYETDRYGYDEPERRGSRAWIWLLLFAAALAAAGIWYILSQNDNSGDNPNPGPSTSQSTPSETPTSETPEPTPTSSTPNPTTTVRETVTSTPSTTPTDAVDTGAAVTNAVDEMSSAVTGLSADDLDPDVAKSIQGLLRDVTKGVRDDDAEAVRSKVGDINDELAQAAGEEKLSQPGQAAVAGPLARLNEAATAFQPSGS